MKYNLATVIIQYTIYMNSMQDENKQQMTRY